MPVLPGSGRRRVQDLDVPDLRPTAILLTQVGATSPIPPAIMREFWGYAAEL